MPLSTVQTIISNTKSPSYVAPVDMWALGWHAYANGLALTDVPEAARRGWRAAWRAESYAAVSEVFGDAGLQAVQA